MWNELIVLNIFLRVSLLGVRGVWYFFGGGRYQYCLPFQGPGWKLQKAGKVNIQDWICLNQAKNIARKRGLVLS